MSNDTFCTDWSNANEIPAFEGASPKGLPLTAYYNTAQKDYLIENDRKGWIGVSETALRRILKAGGHSPIIMPGESTSQLDRKLIEIQRECDVDFAGPLAGHGIGISEMCGNRVLVTTAPKLIEPAEGDWPILRKMMGNLFHDSKYDQTPHLLGWLKTGYESLRERQLRPGQALVMAGEKDCGKSLLQNLITEILGGRSAKPYREMSGGTSFNSELFGAEHLMIEDEVPHTDIRKRLAFGARIKDITVNAVQSYHAKHRPAMSLKPFWRLSISLNIEPENLLILPPMEESLDDKMILLKANKLPMPMPTATLAEREAFWKTLIAELPAFLGFLQSWPIPVELISERFGVTHYHHPEILEAINALAPEVRLLELIDAVIWADHLEEPSSKVRAAKKAESNCTATGLESLLLKSTEFGHEARRLLSWNNATGTYLGRLAKRSCGARREGPKRGFPALDSVSTATDDTMTPNLHILNQYLNLPAQRMRKVENRVSWCHSGHQSRLPITQVHEKTRTHFASRLAVTIR